MILAAITMLSAGQIQPWLDTLGRSDSEILRMGRVEWYRLYSQKYGDSNASHSNSLSAYGGAVRRVNNRLLSDPKLPRRELARKLASLVEKFGVTAVGLGHTIDRNTGWGPVGGGLIADSEEAIYGYLRPASRPKPKPMLVSQVRKALDAQANLLKKAEGAASDDQEKAKKMRTEYAELYTLYSEIVPLIKATTGRTGSDQILGFCLKAAETIDY